ncbi:MAG TPA: hypothetical protein VIL36_05935 [Acidimicrobiales bacterium]
MTTSRRADRRTFARLLAGLLLVAVTGFASSPVAAAPRQEEPVDDVIPTTTTSLAPDAEQGIIPEPNSGRPPEDAGDRGGALQFLVLGLIVVALAGGVTMVVRESRRNLARTRSQALTSPTGPTGPAGSAGDGRR